MEDHCQCHLLSGGAEAECDGCLILPKSKLFIYKRQMSVRRRSGWLGWMPHAQDNYCTRAAYDLQAVIAVGVVWVVRASGSSMEDQCHLLSDGAEAECDHGCLFLPNYKHTFFNGKRQMSVSRRFGWAGLMPHSLLLQDYYFTRANGGGCRGWL